MRPQVFGSILDCCILMCHVHCKSRLCLFIICPLLGLIIWSYQVDPKLNKSTATLLGLGCLGCLITLIRHQGHFWHECAEGFFFSKGPSVMCYFGLIGNQPHQAFALYNKLSLYQNRTTKVDSNWWKFPTTVNEKEFPQINSKHQSMIL